MSTHSPPHGIQVSQFVRAECLTNAETRIIKQVNIADVTKANTLFNNLMGDGVVARKQFLKEYADWSTYNVE